MRSGYLGDMRFRAWLLAPILLLACADEDPTRPIPEDPIDGIFQYVSGDASLEGASLWFQGHEPFQFRLVNPGWVDAQGDTFDIQETGYYWTSGTALTLDVTRHSPPGHVDIYAFAPGENELTFTLESDYLTLSGEEWQTGDQWTTEWTASEFSPLIGQYWFQSSQQATLDAFWDGAVLELDSDFTFNLSNPVNGGGGATTVVESGTYERGDETITFFVEDRDGEAEHFTFPESTTVVAYSQFSLSLQLALEHDGLSDPSTVWTEGEREWWKGETYDNDDPSAAQSLSGTWYYEVHGNLTSGGVSGDTYIGDLDYYLVAPSGNGTLTVNVGWSANADIDVYLYDGTAGTLLNNDGASYTANPESFTEPVSGGIRYYILIAAYEGSGDYLLTADVP
jgi:hypothetical protein